VAKRRQIFKPNSPHRCDRQKSWLDAGDKANKLIGRRASGRRRVRETETQKAMLLRTNLVHQRANLRRRKRAQMLSSVETRRSDGRRAGRFVDGHWENSYGGRSERLAEETEKQLSPANNFNFSDFEFQITAKPEMTFQTSHTTRTPALLLSQFATCNALLDETASGRQPNCWSNISPALTSKFCPRLHRFG